VHVTIRGVPFPRFRQALLRGAPGLYRFGWAPDYPTADNALRPLFHSSSLAPAVGTNVFGYDRPGVDRLLDGAAAAAGPTARRRRYWAAEDLILDRDQGVIPLAVLRRRTVVAERIRGLTYGPFGTADLTRVRVVERPD
jgi:oligopeptide transport system substrate-binding protein